MKLSKILKSFFYIAIIFITFNCSKNSESLSSSDASGKNGSLTRFLTVNNFLYIVDNSSLISYNIATPGQVVFSNKQNVGFNIETIFYHNNQLFIGSNTAMFIYGVSNPAIPNRISQTTYIGIGRDPIVVADTIAYTTLRNPGFGTNLINGGTLSTYNVKNASNPLLTNRTTLRNPYGLAYYQNALYICDGEAGLVVFDKTNKLSPTQLAYVSSTEVFYDAIVEGQTLITFIKGGLAFFNIANPFTPVQTHVMKN